MHMRMSIHTSIHMSGNDLPWWRLPCGGFALVAIMVMAGTKRKRSSAEQPASPKPYLDANSDFRLRHWQQPFSQLLRPPKSHCEEPSPAECLFTLGGAYDCDSDGATWQPHVNATAWQASTADLAQQPHAAGRTWHLRAGEFGFMF